MNIYRRVVDDEVESFSEFRIFYSEWHSTSMRVALSFIIYRQKYCLLFPTVDGHQRKTFDLCTSCPFYRNEFRPNFELNANIFQFYFTNFFFISSFLSIKNLILKGQRSSIFYWILNSWRENRSILRIQRTNLDEYLIRNHNTKLTIHDPVR